jgi:hypothetical protein
MLLGGEHVPLKLLWIRLRTIVVALARNKTPPT